MSTSNKDKRPKFAEWYLKGNGVAYTTSAEIVNSLAGQKAIADSKKLAKRLGYSKPDHL